MKNVLLVEDDETFRKTIRNIIELLGYQVTEAANGLAAKSLFDADTARFELVISDVQMPSMDGVALLKHIRSQNKSVKYILMTGFSELVEAQQAYDLGANEFLPKPFRYEGLKKAISSCYPDKSLPSVTPVDYCQVPIDEFMSMAKLPADLYVRLGGVKYVKIAHAGEMVPATRLKMYKDKKVEFFYVRADERDKIVSLRAS